MNKITQSRGQIAAVALALTFSGLAASQAEACACGCGVFNVGAGMLPDGSRAAFSLDYGFMNQSDNWHGGSSAPASDNNDKDIRTDFITLGAQYRVAKSWIVSASVPYWNRTFRTDTGAGVESFHHSAFSDVSLTATWTGLSKDMSIGLIAGIKLPTGDHSYPNFDPDTAISSGSTDLILGAYKRGGLNRDGTLHYFAHAVWQKPLDWRSNYRPGEEVNVAAGVATAGWNLAHDKANLSPVIQLIASVRARDHGPDGHPSDSGYERLVLAPGLEFQTEHWRLYGHLALPVYQRVNGNQLTAPVMFKATLTRNF